MKAFNCHVIQQISGRLSRRAIDESPTAVIETAVQFMFNLGAATVYTDMSKERSYNRTEDLRILIADRSRSLEETARLVRCELMRLSNIYAEELKDYEFDTPKIKR
jgi:hypothetical protein